MMGAVAGVALKISLVSGWNGVGSTCSPVGRVVMILPLSASGTPIFRLLQPMSRRRFLRSISILAGASHGAVGHCPRIFISFGSILTRVLTFSRLTQTVPLLSVTGNSGWPANSLVLSALPSVVALTVNEFALRLEANDRLVVGS